MKIIMKKMKIIQFVLLYFASYQIISKFISTKKFSYGKS